jgi:succinyl-CoA synthetase alpha subunit
MTVLLDADTRVVVQGITGHQGTVHTAQMKAFGTNVVAGVTPGKGGTEVGGVPVYDAVEDAARRHGANTSVIFVPAPFAKDALLEAVDAGIRLAVIVTEHIPFHDMLTMYHYAKLRGTRIVGPNCPGLAAPGVAKAGIIPNVVFRPGEVGVVSRSGTLTYEIVNGIKEAGLGQSTCVGLGGDPVPGTSFVDALPLFEADPKTKIIVMVGEIGGTAEEEAAEFIRGHVRKPVVAYVAGRSAPPGKRMGHAGAIIARGRGTAESKSKALTDAGAEVAQYPYEIPALVAARLRGARA